MDISSSVRYGPEITAAATSYGLDPRLLAAVAAQESGGPGSDSGRNITGDGGHGRGVFQIDDRSWSFAKTPAAMDPAQNARMAASILSSDLKASGGDVRAALSTYNAGSPTARGTQTTWADGQTLGYADSVLRHYDDLAAAAPAGSPAELGASSPAGGVRTLADLTAEQPETSASVGTLANYEANLPPLMATFSPPPAVPTTSAGLQAAAAVGAQADKTLASLVGGDDLDGDGGDGDSD